MNQKGWKNLTEIDEDALLGQVKAGRLSLQLGEYSITFSGDPAPPPPTMIPCRPEYFLVLKDRRPIVGVREEGFLFLSPAGFRAFKSRLKAAFSAKRGHTWQEFENRAKTFFEDVRKRTTKYEKQLADKLAAIQAIKI
jgi:hypothetical protein